MIQTKNFIYFPFLLGVAGCATLPSSGPTRGQIERTAKAPESGPPIQLIEIRTVADLPSTMALEAKPAFSLPELAPPPTDLIGPGDVLDINIYEAGVTLFAGRGDSGGSSQGGSSPGMSSPGVQVQKLPPTRVDDLGNIGIPYAGTLHVAGVTTGDVEAMIRRALRGISQNPQVIVTLSQTITNSIIFGGEVARPGRLVLQTNRETLSDVIALAGGYRGNPKDLILRVMRGTQTVDIRVNDLADYPQLDVRAYPGDRMMLISNPRTYSVLGGSSRVEQLPFSRSNVSLAEAVATAGGANPGIGDPAAIFLFRYNRDERGVETPVVYHLNMMKTGSYFVAQRFAMRDKDVLYFGNAAANQPSKVVQLVSQLFSPLLTVTAAVQAVRN